MSYYTFISEPDPNFTCSICLDLSSQPKQCEDCGKLFCSECIEKNGKKPCPNCRAINPRYFRDVKSGRDIKDIRVCCSSGERGCPWTGTIGTLDTHIVSCKFVLIPCPNNCEDDKDAGETKIMRKDLDDHIKTKCPKRPFRCQHCGKRGRYASITGDHDKVCDKKIVACPNKESGCLLQMKQEKIEEHVSVCVYTEVACEYESLGCGVRMLRKDIKKHESEDNVSHLHLVLGVVKLLSEQKNTLTAEGEPLVFKIPGFAIKKENNETFHSVAFYTHPGGYKMSISVDVNGTGASNGTHVSVSTKLLKGRYDDQLHWPFLGTVKYELLNQLADSGHHYKVSEFKSIHQFQVGNNWGFKQFFSHSSFCHDPATNTQYLLNDTLYFRVSVKVDNHKPWLVCTDNINTDSSRASTTEKTLKNGESFVFTLPSYNKRQAIYDIVRSNPFYTSIGGYKMCIDLYPKGYGIGKDTHVSVYVQLIEGTYDARLSWPFAGKVTITLLNQLSDGNHHSKTMEYETSQGGNVGDGLGYHQFISHSELKYDPVQNTQYLRNDTLYFRVSVQDNNYKSWLACTFN